MSNLEKWKQEFSDIFERCVTRSGAWLLLAYLENCTDFFTAPASTKYHGAYPGGLAEHSLNVYHRLRAFTIRDVLEGESEDLPAECEESIAIMALLHDVCKTNCYVAEINESKAAADEWAERQVTYVFRDPQPLGHGEKSLFIILKHMKLTNEEALAIRWHMGAYDEAVKGGGRAMTEAMGMTPWVWRLQEADMCATWIDERGGRP